MTADKAQQTAAESWLQQQMVHLQLKVRPSCAVLFCSFFFLEKKKKKLRRLGVRKAQTPHGAELFCSML